MSFFDFIYYKVSEFEVECYMERNIRGLLEIIPLL